MDEPDPDDEWSKERVCEVCGQTYKMADQDETYFDPPYDYRSGWKGTCLACWLGVGPKDFPEFYNPQTP